MWGKTAEQVNMAHPTHAGPRTRGTKGICPLCQFSSASTNTAVTDDRPTGEGAIARPPFGRGRVISQAACVETSDADGQSAYLSSGDSVVAISLPLSTPVQ